MNWHFYNTTNLTGEELRSKQKTAKSQEERLFLILVALENSVEWWTRDALNREHARRFGVKLKPQSISRALSNLSALWCPACKEYVYKRHCKCGVEIDWQTPKFEKSATAMFKSEEDDTVHGWRLWVPAEPVGQLEAFPGAITKEGLRNE